MRDETAWEPLRDVLRNARARGCPLTRAQLHRWQQSGLIPSPKRPGRGRGLGSETFYEPGTTDQAVAVSRYLKENRSITVVLFRLFWDSYQVPEATIRNLLAIELGTIRGVDDLFGGKNPEGKKHLLKKVRKRSPDRVIERWRKSLGQSGFEVLLGYIAQVGTGRFPGFVLPVEKSGVARALAVPPKEVDSFLSTLMEIVNVGALETALGSRLTEILNARDELKSTILGVSDLIKFGSGFLGQNLAVDIFREGEWSAGLYLSLILVLLSIRKHSRFLRIWNVLQRWIVNRQKSLEIKHGKATSPK